MSMHSSGNIQYIPRNMHTGFALLCFVVVIQWLIFPYPPGLLLWHCGNLTIAPVPAKQPWWIWINTSCEFIMNDCITTTKQSTTKPCAYFVGYTVTLILAMSFPYNVLMNWVWTLLCRLIIKRGVNHKYFLSAKQNWSFIYNCGANYDALTTMEWMSDGLKYPYDNLAIHMISLPLKTYWHVRNQLMLPCSHLNGADIEDSPMILYRGCICIGNRIDCGVSEYK